MGLKPCIIDGCEKPVRTRNWCYGHHARWLRTGDPEQEDPHFNQKPTNYELSREDFWDRVDKLRRERIMGV